VQDRADNSKKSEFVERNKLAITINIYYTGKNRSALSFAEEMLSSGIVNEIRAEKGNLRYDYFYPMNDAETVLLIDSWENQKALDIHHASPMMEQITRLREKYNLSMKVERYISDEAGIPDTDKKYIRD
jgi:quinol monooxygenase YgiN